MYYNLELQQDIQGLTGVDGVIVAVVHKPYRESLVFRKLPVCVQMGCRL
jgi:hypothetical protein